MHAFSHHAARPRAAHTRLRGPLARLRIGGRAALVRQIDELINEPLTDAERVTKICQLIYPPDRSYDRARD